MSNVRLPFKSNAVIYLLNYLEDYLNNNKYEVTVQIGILVKMETPF